jgi:hypothetical protein
MGQTTTGFSSSVCLCSLRLVLLTTTVLLCWEIGSQRSSLAQVQTAAPEVPEEMLQTQIITEANSPLTGLAQSASNNTKAQSQLQVAATEVLPRLAPSIYRTVELLRLRKLLKSLLPFF